MLGQGYCFSRTQHLLVLKVYVVVSLFCPPYTALIVTVYVVPAVRLDADASLFAEVTLAGIVAPPVVGLIVNE